MTQWFTSDLHFAHPHVAKLRGFEDYREHDETIIRNLNELVAPDDDLYVLGDISSGSKTSLDEALRLLHRLNVGRTHRVLVLGNHDTTRLEAGKMRKFITEFSQVALRGTTTIPSAGHVLLSHYPWAEHMNGSKRADLSTNALDTHYKRLAPSIDFYNLLLHGHTHATTPYEFKTALLRQKVSPDYTQINIGLDAWDLKPVSEEQIEELWLENLVNM